MARDVGRGVYSLDVGLALRVKHGVCPCCNRHFDNVEAHMATAHPDFDPVALEV